LKVPKSGKGPELFDLFDIGANAIEARVRGYSN
jgi:hypothetical protein